MRGVGGCSQITSELSSLSLALWESLLPGSSCLLLRTKETQVGKCLILRVSSWGATGEGPQGWAELLAMSPSLAGVFSIVTGAHSQLPQGTICSCLLSHELWALRGV